MAGLAKEERPQYRWRALPCSLWHASGGGDKSDLSLYSLKIYCNHLDFEGAKSVNTIWGNIAEDESAGSEEASATVETIGSFLPDCSVNVKDTI